MKSVNLNFLEPSGPLQACNGTALPFYVVSVVDCWMCRWVAYIHSLRPSASVMAVSPETTKKHSGHWCGEVPLSRLFLSHKSEPSLLCHMKQCQSFCLPENLKKFRLQTCCVADRTGRSGVRIPMGTGFPHLSRPALRPTSPRKQWLQGHLRGLSCCGLALTTHRI